MSNVGEPKQTKGPYALLSEEVDKVLKERNWSLRQAEIQTSIPFNTISRMHRGFSVEAESVARFAFKISAPDKRFETVLHWLRLARKDDFVSLLSAVKDAARSVPEDAGERIILPSGTSVLVLPNGRELSLTRENIALIDSVFSAVEQAQQQPE